MSRNFSLGLIGQRIPLGNFVVDASPGIYGLGKPGADDKPLMEEDSQLQHPPEPMALPIEGELDLHTFRPQDVKVVVTEYLAACRERGILEVRIVHGKGMGVLRQTVHALLTKHPDVIRYNLATEPFGGWGATMVHLRPMGQP